MEERPSIWKVGLNNGLIVGLAVIIYSFILFLLDLQTNRWLSILSYVILLGGIIWTHQNYKKSSDGFMTYSEGLGLGALVSGVVGVASGIFTVIYTKIIDPQFMERTMQEQMVELRDQGMSQEQIDQMQGMVSFMQSPIALFFISVLGFLFFGFILTLIISAFTKKNNPTLYI